MTYRPEYGDVVRLNDWDLGDVYAVISVDENDGTFAAVRPATYMDNWEVEFFALDDTWVKEAYMAPTFAFNIKRREYDRLLRNVRELEKVKSELITLGLELVSKGYQVSIPL